MPATSANALVIMQGLHQGDSRTHQLVRITPRDLRHLALLRALSRLHPAAEHVGAGSLPRDLRWACQVASSGSISLSFVPCSVRSTCYATEEGESRFRMTLKSHDLRVPTPGCKKSRPTMVGEGGDSDTLGDDHPQYLVASGTRRFPLETSAAEYPIDAFGIP
jgi:hypothetical protein